LLRLVWFICITLRKSIKSV